MPDLIQSLQGRDLGHLKIIAELWGLDFSAPDAKVGLQRLAPRLLDRDALVEALQTLPDRARHALDELLHGEGRLPWPAFERRFGAVREMGPARRDREHPYQAAKASASEALWYRGLVARDFFDSPSGPQEFAYVPEDLLALLAEIPEASLGGGGRPAAMGRLATPAEKAVILPGSDAILDDACTLLAALRCGIPDHGVPAATGGSGHYLLVNSPHLPYPLTVAALLGLLDAAGLLDKQGQPRPDPVRRFLESPRAEALLDLAKAWLRSATYNDLRLMPSVTAEGEWSNDPLRARRAILDNLSTVPGAFSVSDDPAERPFWSVHSLIGSVRQTDPDFQRSAGEYDTWYLRNNASGEYLRGFEHWEAVEGELIRFVIAGPLHWLGIVDLGFAKPQKEPDEGEFGEANGNHPRMATAFRFTGWAACLLNLEVPKGLGAETESFSAGSDGRLRVPRLVRRSVRYQAARFAAWERIAQDQYVYRLTPGSLQSANRQGLRVSHLMTLLRRHAQPIPPSLVQALERWETDGSAARVDRLVVIRVKDPELLQTLRSSRLSRYLGEPLGPTAVIVRPGAVDKLLDGLVEMGYLGEVSFNGEP